MANVYTKKRLSKSEKADLDIINEAFERYQECEPVCSEIYKDAMDDVEFSIGKQWNDKDTKDRQDRPSLVENRLAGTIHQVCNDQRQNRSMVKVTARDDVADPKVAKIINGLLRYIQYNSDSETAMDSAFENAVRGGIGWFRIVTDYADDNTFDQDIFIKRIEDINTVKVPIHLCREIDFRDMPYAFVETSISKEAFEKECPDADVDGWPSTGRFEGWLDDKRIRIAEYFVVEKEYYDVYLLTDGTITDKKPDDVVFDELGNQIANPITVENTRQACNRKIKWYKMTAGQILDRKNFPGKWIPIVPVIGEMVNISGKIKIMGLTYNAKDPQRMLNYWRSAEAERIALAPKAPYVAAANQIEGYEDEWQQANRTNINVLHYNPVIEGGTLVPAPQRQQPTSMDMAIVNAARESIDAIKACTGIFDASLGKEGNAKSGVAVNALARQGDTSNYHFFDNMAKSQRHACRIMVDMIPEIYDAERSIRIMGEDMKEEVVVINKLYDADGKLYDLKAGKYDVIVETGPSFMSKRQETAANLQNLAQSDPVIVQCARDLILKYMDLPTEVVERARKTIDPQFLQEDGKEPDAKQIMAQAQQAQQQSQMQMQQMDQVIQQMSAENEQLTAKLNAKSDDNQTKLAIADLQAKVDIMVAEIRAGIENDKMKHEVGIEAMRHVHGVLSKDHEANLSAEMNPPPQPGAQPELEE